MLKEFCKEQFVSKGMIADFAIHDKGDGNPHAHILLTIRAMDEHGKWLPKARKVYDLDENSERIQPPIRQLEVPQGKHGGLERPEVCRGLAAQLGSCYKPLS